MPWPDGPGVLELPDGRRVRARSLRGPAEPAADLGVYLTGRPPPDTPWPQLWLAWPDFGLPRSPEEALDVLVAAHRAAADRRVEIACTGGTGRTGTALALFAVLSGVEPGKAVHWVRAAYRPRAVETPWQRRWVATAGMRLRGRRPR